MKRNSFSITHISIFIVILLLTSLIFIDGALNNLSASDYEIVSTFSINNSKPQIKVDKDNNIHIVWQGIVDGKEHIFYREMRNNKWEDIVIIDNELSEKNKNPFIILDNNTNIHIFWSGKINSNFRIFHSYRINGYWYKDKNPVDNLPEQDNEYPNAVVDEYNTIHLVWFSGNSINDRIYYGISRDKIHFDIYGPLDNNPNNYNWFPQLFNLEKLLLTYFASINSNFFVKVLEVDESDILEKNNLDYDLETTISNKLPQILTKDGKELMALWYDTYKNYDRIFLLMNQNISIIDDNANEDNYFPFGVFDNKNNLHIVWCSSNQSESKILYKFITSNYTSNKEVIINDVNKYFSSPKIDIDNSGTPYLVWYSSYSDGGNGSIYYQKLSAKEPTFNSSVSYSNPFSGYYDSTLNAITISLINDKSLAYNIYRKKAEDFFNIESMVVNDFSGSEFIDFNVIPKEKYIYRVEIYDKRTSGKILLDSLSIPIDTNLR